MQTTEPSLNPYAAPQAPLARVAADSRSWTQRIYDEWKRGTWPLVFMGNLGVPMMLGFGLCSNTGKLGIVLTTSFLLVFTTWLVAANPLRRQRWIAGGNIVGLWQLFPVFHFLLGILSLELLAHLQLVRHLTFGNGDEPLMYEDVEFLPACLLTLMVGGGLLLFAMLMGIWRVSIKQKTLHGAPTTGNV